MIRFMTLASVVGIACAGLQETYGQEHYSCPFGRGQCGQSASTDLRTAYQPEPNFQGRCSGVGGGRCPLGNDRAYRGHSHDSTLESYEPVGGYAHRNTLPYPPHPRTLTYGQQRQFDRTDTYPPAYSRRPAGGLSSAYGPSGFYDRPQMYERSRIDNYPQSSSHDHNGSCSHDHGSTSSQSGFYDRPQTYEQSSIDNNPPPSSHGHGGSCSHDHGSQSSLPSFDPLSNDSFPPQLRSEPRQPNRDLLPVPGQSRPLSEGPPPPPPQF